MGLFMRGTYRIVEILKKTKAKGFEDVRIGDIIAFEITLAKRGSDKNLNWLRPLVDITNLSTGFTVTKDFSTTVNLLENFEWELEPL